MISNEAYNEVEEIKAKLNRVSNREKDNSIIIEKM